MHPYPPDAAPGSALGTALGILGAALVVLLVCAAVGWGLASLGGR